MVCKIRIWFPVIVLILFLLIISADAGHSRSHVTKVTCRSSLRTPVGYPPQDLVLRSTAAVVEDQQTGELLIQKHARAVVPIASITKLMTAMVVLDAFENMEGKIRIQTEDIDRIRHSRSRLPIGSEVSRADALLVALMASDNRAAAALGRTYPGGTSGCVAAMNAKARAMGLSETYFRDATGLSTGNVSSARDLLRLVEAAYQYGTIRVFTTRKHASIPAGRRWITFYNTNQLIDHPRWEIGLSKTGYLEEAGRCLVMQAQIADRSVLIVLLDSQGKLTRVGDANRIRKWLEETSQIPQTKRG